MAQPVLITGATGQLGQALSLLGEPGTLALSRKQFDLARDKIEIIRQLDQLNPQVIFNAAAYTQVDQAESEPDLAYQINAHAVGHLAHWCARQQVPLIHFSTDYVFSGAGQRAWQEEDPTDPINLYGASKQAGEVAVIDSGAPYLICRTSWVYDANGRNFLNTMLRLFRSRDEVAVVADQVGAPTYAAHLAQMAWTMFVKARSLPIFPSGIYHVASQGECSWHGFAEAIRSQAQARGWELQTKVVRAITSSEYKTPARRPLNSRLDCHKIEREFGLKRPTWQEGLQACLEVKGES